MAETFAVDAEEDLSGVGYAERERGSEAAIAAVETAGIAQVGAAGTGADAEVADVAGAGEMSAVEEALYTNTVAGVGVAAGDAAGGGGGGAAAAAYTNTVAGVGVAAADAAAAGAGAVAAEIAPVDDYGTPAGSRADTSLVRAGEEESGGVLAVKLLVAVEVATGAAASLQAVATAAAMVAEPHSDLDGSRRMKLQLLQSLMSMTRFHARKVLAYSVAHEVVGVYEIQSRTAPQMEVRGMVASLKKPRRHQHRASLRSSCRLCRRSEEDQGYQRALRSRAAPLWLLWLEPCRRRLLMVP